MFADFCFSLNSVTIHICLLCFPLHFLTSELLFETFPHHLNIWNPFWLHFAFQYTNLISRGDYPCRCDLTVTSHFGISVVTFTDSQKTSPIGRFSLLSGSFPSPCRRRRVVTSALKGITLVQAYCSFTSILIYSFLLWASHLCSLSLWGSRQTWEGCCTSSHLSPFSRTF